MVPLWCNWCTWLRWWRPEPPRTPKMMAMMVMAKAGAAGPGEGGSRRTYCPMSNQLIQRPSQMTWGMKAVTLHMGKAEATMEMMHPMTPEVMPTIFFKELLNKEVSRKRGDIQLLEKILYSAFRKYSQHLTFSTFCCYSLNLKWIILRFCVTGPHTIPHNVIVELCF